MMLKIVTEYLMMKIIFGNSEYVKEFENLKREGRRGFLSKFELYQMLYDCFSSWALKNRLVYMPEMQNLTDARSNPGFCAYSMSHICMYSDRIINEMAFNIADEVVGGPVPWPTEVREEV